MPVAGHVEIVLALCTMDISYGRIRYEIHHGGKFKSDNQYIGGTFESDDDIDIERITFEELESFVKNMGYHSAIQYAFRDMNGLEKYYFFHDERSLYGTLNLHFAMPFNCLKVYIEALTADLTETGCYVDVGNEVCVKDKYEHLEYDAEGNQTEYENSDTSEASLDSDKDAKFIIRKKVSLPKVYSKNCDHQSLTFEIEMRFNDCNECKEAVRLSAILNGHNIKWKKSGGGKLEAVCEPGCPWRLYASKLNGEPTCVIKTLKSEHKCFRAFCNRQSDNLLFIAAEQSAGFHWASHSSR
ncbi:hypothetical protein C2S52_002280 [Perilla frutescens var. hirtella]|nr:hypothetical protein C2S52_002280 [Perilla frutescens var. hirtella]